MAIKKRDVTTEVLIEIRDELRVLTGRVEHLELATVAGFTGVRHELDALAAEGRQTNERLAQLAGEGRQTNERLTHLARTMNEVALADRAQLTDHERRLARAEAALEDLRSSG
jgi:hypothetical protein